MVKTASHGSAQLGEDPAVPPEGQHVGQAPNATGLSRSAGTIGFGSRRRLAFGGIVAIAAAVAFGGIATLLRKVQAGRLGWLWR
jgi:hypothetical protein